MTQVKLGEWLQNVFGINIQYTAHLLSILQHPTFQQIFLYYCCTHYSKHLFSLSLAVKIVHSKLDHVRTPYNPFSDNLTNHGYCIWFKKLGQFFDSEEKIFGSRYVDLSYDDWKKILDIEIGQPDYPLQVLFFPTREDYFDGETHHHAPWWICDSSLPHLSKPFSMKEHTFHFCWSEFLEAFNNNEYCDVFKALQANCDLEIPMWWGPHSSLNTTQKY